MRKLSILGVALAMCFGVHAGTLSADEPGTASPIQLTGALTGGSVDVHPHECDECGYAHDQGTECIERIPVEDCVTGKKKVYDCKVRYEYVSIPEVRYRWKTKWVTKKIPACYYKPVCKAEKIDHSYGAERWDKQCDGCGKLHCKSIECKREKQECKYCDTASGKTTIKVCYKTCVKEPYTVYRQVRKPVCVKQPRYEKVKVPITRYECRDVECEECDGAGCDSCCP